MGNFYKEVIQKDLRFRSPSRVNDPNLLEPVTRRAVALIIAEAKAGGIALLAFETFRSQARQRQLFNQGATQLANVGVHNYGLACDLVKLVKGETSWAGDFAFLGRLAKKHGLIWGGDWGEPARLHTFRDYVHVQRCRVADQQKLFSGGWYPGQDYDPYGGVRSTGETPVPPDAGSTGIGRIIKPTKPYMTGPDVQEVLILLQKRGYYGGKLDSTYGPRAEAAVHYFQDDNGLEIDGQVGPQTLAALRQ
jgi:hypothetical protein